LVYIINVLFVINRQQKIGKRSLCNNNMAANLFTFFTHSLFNLFTNHLICFYLIRFCFNYILYAALSPKLKMHTLRFRIFILFSPQFPINIYWSVHVAQCFFNAITGNANNWFLWTYKPFLWPTCLSLLSPSPSRFMFCFIFLYILIFFRSSVWILSVVVH